MVFLALNIEVENNWYKHLQSTNKKVLKMEEGRAKKSGKTVDVVFGSPSKLTARKNAHKIALKWLFSFSCKDAKICTKI